jgi:Carboxypeptidase regulatory-like domain
MSSRTKRRLVICGIVALCATGCSKPQGSESPASLATVDPATTGSITGRVTLDGPPPVLQPIDMSASPACVQANAAPVVPPLVVTGDNGALANVVIYVKDGLGNYRFDTPKDPVVLMQKNCMYEPHILALMTNQPFEIENNDPTMHNVHPMPKHNRQWSTSQPVGSAALKSTFARPELAMPVLCNVHPWMRSFVFAFDNPYFAVTSRDGEFELRNLPPGTYTIEAWQEKFGTQDQSVTVSSKQAKAIAFTFRADTKSGD